MRVGIDIDNVISNFDDVLFEEFLHHDEEIRNTGVVNEQLYMTKGMFDWSKDEIKNFYHANIERIAKNLKVKDRAKEYIDKLQKDGHTILIISARDNGDYVDPLKLTLEWLKEQEISYDELILTQSPIQKVKVCQEKRIDIMIDDSITVCSNVEHVGTIPLLMSTPYNQNADIQRVSSWKEIYDFVLNYRKKKMNVILDTDTYNECDDQFALAYMLKSQDLFNIEAITIAPYSHKSRVVSVREGQDLSYNEVLKICNWFHFDVLNKVFKGSMDYLVNGYNEVNDAVKKIIEIALKNDKTYIMAIGALTNVAIAIKTEPKIIDKIEIVWLGGHSLEQENNLEFNFKQDIEAVRVVFESKVKLTVIPCKNVASNLMISINELNQYLKGKNELCNYLIKRFYNDGYHGIQDRRVIWDISVIAYLINRNWFKIDKISCPIINDDTTYFKTKNRHEITFVYDLDANKIYDDLFKKLGDFNEIN